MFVLHELHEFPVAVDDGGDGGGAPSVGAGAEVAGEVLEDGGAFQGRGGVFEEGDEAFAVLWLISGGLGGGDFDQGGVEIDVDGRDAAGRAGFGDAGPADDEGDAGAAFVEAAFAAAEGGVVGDVAAFFHEAFAFVAADAAVVAGEDEDGVVAEVEFIKLGHDATDAFVDAGDHGGVDRVVVTGDAGLGFEFLYEFFLGLIGGVDTEVGEVEEEGGVFFALDEVDGFVGEEVSEVGVFGDVGFGVGLEVDVFAIGDEGFVEAAFAGVMAAAFAEVPFAEHGGGVTGGFEGLGEDGDVEGEAGDVIGGAEGAGLPVEAVDAADGVDAGAGTVLAAHEGGAGGLAVLGVVMASEFEALGSEFVDVGGFVVGAAEGAGVGVAEVICHDEDDVGLGGENGGG